MKLNIQLKEAFDSLSATLSAAAKRRIAKADWYRYGGRKLAFDNHHRSYDVDVMKGDKVGFIDGRNSIVMIHEDAPDIQFKVSFAELEKIRLKSKPFTGTIEGVKVSGGETKPAKTPRTNSKEPRLSVVTRRILDGTNKDSPTVLMRKLKKLGLNDLTQIAKHYGLRVRRSDTGEKLIDRLEKKIGASPASTKPSTPDTSETNRITVADVQKRINDLSATLKATKPGVTKEAIKNQLKRQRTLLRSLQKSSPASSQPQVDTNQSTLKIDPSQLSVGTDVMVLEESSTTALKAVITKMPRVKRENLKPTDLITVKMANGKIKKVNLDAIVHILGKQFGVGKRKSPITKSKGPIKQSDLREAAKRADTKEASKKITISPSDLKEGTVVSVNHEGKTIKAVVVQDVTGGSVFLQKGTVKKGGKGSFFTGIENIQRIVPKGVKTLTPLQKEKADYDRLHEATGAGAIVRVRGQEYVVVHGRRQKQTSRTRFNNKLSIVPIDESKPLSWLKVRDLNHLFKDLMVDRVSLQKYKEYQDIYDRRKNELNEKSDAAFKINEEQLNKLGVKVGDNVAYRFNNGLFTVEVLDIDYNKGNIAIQGSGRKRRWLPAKNIEYIKRTGDTTIDMS